MQKQLLLLLMVCGFAAYGHTQETDSSTYIYLKTGEYVFGDVIRFDEEHETSLFTTKTYRLVYLDYEKYTAEQIRFVHFDKQHYAVVEHLSRHNEPDFAEMIRQGKINLYESLVFESRGEKKDHKYARHLFYYNKGMGKIHKFKYGKMEKEFAGHSTAMKHLQKSRNMLYYEYTSRIGSVLYLFGNAGYFANTAINKDIEKDKAFLFSPTHYVIADLFINLGVFAAIYLPCYYFRVKKNEHLKISVDAYNKLEP
ncbi:MAG: hypothetical protein R6U19_09135 [Bacteroidales bacterium]